MARAESGSIQQLGKDRWRVRVSGGNDPVTGKRIRLTRTVHGTKKDAIAERTRMQIEVGDMDRATKSITIAQYLNDVFLPYQEKNLRRSSYVAERWRIGKYIIPSLGHIQVSKLSAYTVEIWMKGIESPFMLDAAFKVLRHAYNLAYKWSIIQNNIFDKIDPPSREYGDKVVADADLASMIIGAMHGESIEPIFLLELSCGLRMSEALALDWEDIDFKTGKVRIYKTYHYVQGEGCMFLDVKTKKSKRTVTVPRSVLDRLLEIRCKDGIMRFGALCECTNRRNGIRDRITPQAYRHKYKRTFEKKLPNETYITPRNLRHSHATILLTQGVDIKTIADRLGHSSTRITTAVYLQHVDELDVAASDVFDTAIRVASPHKEPDNIVHLPPAKEA